MSNRKTRSNRIKANAQQGADADIENKAAAAGATTPEAGAASTAQPDPDNGQADTQQAHDTSKANDAPAAGATTPEAGATSTAQPNPDNGQADTQQAPDTSKANDAGAMNDTEETASVKKDNCPIAKQLVRYKGKTYGPGESAGTALPSDIDADTLDSFRALDAIE